MSKDTSAPVFPCTEAHGLNSGVPGMSLRQYYAGLAMSNRFGPRGSTMPFDELANLCFQLADAMLAEGNK